MSESSFLRPPPASPEILALENIPIKDFDTIDESKIVTEKMADKYLRYMFLSDLVSSVTITNDYAEGRQDRFIWKFKASHPRWKNSALTDGNSGDILVETSDLDYPDGRAYIEGVLKLVSLIFAASVGV